METTQIKQLFNSLAETFSQNSTIKKIYGDPIETQGKTITPVAKVSMGFGGGFGGAGDKNEASSSDGQPTDNKGQGGGMGGGLSAKPVGIIEITPNQTRFIRFHTAGYIALGMVMGLAFGMLGKRSWGRPKYPAL